MRVIAKIQWKQISNSEICYAHPLCLPVFNASGQSTHSAQTNSPPIIINHLYQLREYTQGWGIGVGIEFHVSSVLVYTIFSTNMADS